MAPADKPPSEETGPALTLFSLFLGSNPPKSTWFLLVLMDFDLPEAGTADLKIL
jgi:hypothetical protein